MHEISDVKRLIDWVDTIYVFRLFDDILVNVMIGFLNFDTFIFKIIDKQKFLSDLFNDMFTYLSDCFIDDLDDGFWF
jgi:hypothetical protein